MNEHNHEFDLENVHFFLSFRKISTLLMSQIQGLDAPGVQPSKIVSILGKQVGGIRNTQCTKKDGRNVIGGYTRELVSTGDARVFQDYLVRNQLENPYFFYSLDIHDDHRLENVLEIDSQSCVDYQYFGDAISFETIYMPFAPFVGVNHHRQLILLGCSLLRDETKKSYIWLLKTWLQAMGGKSPRAIITDQDKAIIAAVFPTSCHRFCLCTS